MLAMKITPKSKWKLRKKLSQNGILINKIILFGKDYVRIASTVIPLAYPFFVVSLLTSDTGFSIAPIYLECKCAFHDNAHLYSLQGVVLKPKIACYNPICLFCFLLVYL